MIEKDEHQTKDNTMINDRNKTEVSYNNSRKIKTKKAQKSREDKRKLSN